MIEAVDLVVHAARNGLVISHAIAGQALDSVDQASIEAEQRARYRAHVWDGKSDPPVGSRDRWLHGKDGNSQSAIEAIEGGGVVYFLFRDLDLAFWQPHRADKAGRIHMVDDPNNDDHWEKAVAGHVALCVEHDVRNDVLRAALNKALILHEQQGIPYHSSSQSS